MLIAVIMILPKAIFVWAIKPWILTRLSKGTPCRIYYPQLPRVAAPSLSVRKWLFRRLMTSLACSLYPGFLKRNKGFLLLCTYVYTVHCTQYCRSVANPDPDPPKIASKMCLVKPNSWIHLNYLWTVLRTRVDIDRIQTSRKNGSGFDKSLTNHQEKPDADPTHKKIWNRIRPTRKPRIRILWIRVSNIW